MSALPNGYDLRTGADAAAAQAFLAGSYWNEGVTLKQVELALSHSASVSVWHDGVQVGTARVVSDRVTIAYLNDVYVLPQHRGKGLARAMVDVLRDDPAFAEVGRWLLFTKDAQDLYAAAGFRQYPWPERTMIVDEKVFPR